MTRHSSKGLEFDTVFLPGWEEGVFPSQRTLDESGRAGLEEERRLAHVGLTRARKRAKLYFASNRRIHGMWNTTVPSRFLDELPEADVEVKEAQGGAGGFGMGGYGASRFDDMNFGSNYTTPGWRRAQQRKTGGDDEDGFDETGAPQLLQMLRRIGDGQADPLRQHLDIALTLGELLQQLQTMSMRHRLGHRGEAGEQRDLGKLTWHRLSVRGHGAIVTQLAAQLQRRNPETPTLATIAKLRC